MVWKRNYQRSNLIKGSLLVDAPNVEIVQLLVEENKKKGIDLAHTERKQNWNKDANMLEQLKVK